MKNMLKFEYNIEIDKITFLDDKYFFYIDYNKFYIIKIKRPITDIEEILKLLLDNINKFHRPIFNKNKQPYTLYEGEYYILFKVIAYENEELDLKDIVQNQIPITYKYKGNILRTNWGSLWASKIDYLEYQVSELGKMHPIIQKTFSYYVGLGENAIQYFNLLKLDEETLTLAHRSIKYPNYSKDFYNPLNLVVDYRVRDTAEYLKTLFFNNQDWNLELETYLNKNILTKNEYNLLFVRMLYPSYYFKEVTKILENRSNDDILLKYVDKINEYEDFLRKLFSEISKRYPLISIDWLIKKVPFKEQ